MDQPLEHICRGRQRRRHDPVGAESLCMVRPVPPQLGRGTARPVVYTLASTEVVPCTPSPSWPSPGVSELFFGSHEPRRLGLAVSGRGQFRCEVRFFKKCFFKMMLPHRLSHLRLGMCQRHCATASQNWWGDGAAAFWWDGAASGHMPEATQDFSAATAWYGSAQDTAWTPLPDSLRVNVSRLLQRVIHREGYASSANQTTQRRTEHLWVGREVDCGAGPSSSQRKRGYPTVCRRSGCWSTCKCDCGT